MSMYKCSKTSGSLKQYYRDEPASVNGVIVNFPADNNNSASFKFKQEITGETDNAEIMVLLKYLSNFLRTLEMPLINCEINLVLTWSVNCKIM